MGGHVPRFVVAKYIPDLNRMEPRNIGVFLWARRKVWLKFLPASRAKKIVSEIDTYRRWVRFWGEAAAGVAPVLTIDNPGTRERRIDQTPLELSDPACMDRLIRTGRGNYTLHDAGFLMDHPRSKSDVEAALLQLFNELVLPAGQRKAVK